jgi:hypothetical protein
MWGPGGVSDLRVCNSYPSKVCPRHSHGPIPAAFRSYVYCVCVGVWCFVPKWQESDPVPRMDSYHGYLQLRQLVVYSEKDRAW